MALILNYSILLQNPLFTQAGLTVSDNPNAYNQTGMLRNQYYGECAIAGQTEQASYPEGYRPPYAWSLAPKDGALACTFGILGSGGFSINPNLAAGVNISADFSGVGGLTNASMGLIVSAVAALSGSGTLSASAIGALNASVDFVGSGNLTAALGALAGAVANMTGSGTLSAGIIATANISANITPFTELSPQNLAIAVWEALAESFNNPGTMGAKLNSAANAGDPWGTTLPGSYPVGTAGYILSKQLLTVSKFLGLK